MTTRRTRLLACTAVVAAAALAPAGVSQAHGEPTCADFEALGIVVHGQHVVRDYVMGAGSLEWPPAGAVGQAIGGSGAAVPGGPGPGFHFPHGFAPGASFCLPQSKAPGFHVPA